MGRGISGLFNNTKGGCFIAGTLILTEYGLKPIENVKQGDYVFSKNTETGKLELKKVKETFVHIVNNLIHLYFKDTKIISTLEHPFWIYNKGWTFAEEIKENDFLINESENIVSVKKVEKIILNEYINVYNFHVEDYHTYFVSKLSILVHNNSKNDIYKRPKSGSGKEKSTDVPVWAKGFRPYKNENGNEFAKRLMDMKYGRGNYKIRGNHEYSSIKKWGDRGFE